MLHPGFALTRIEWTDYLTVDRVVLLLGVVLAGVAALFSFLEWKARRRKPNLAAVVDRVNFGTVSEKRSVSFHLILRNDGQAPAIGWRVSGITATHRWEAFDAEDGRFASKGTRDHSTIIWRAVSADETIEPGQQVRIGLGMGTFDPHEVPHLDMSIQARDMKPFGATLRVSWPEDQDEPQVGFGKGLSSEARS